jgi:stage IV sporulation protein FB
MTAIARPFATRYHEWQPAGMPQRHAARCGLRRVVALLETPRVFAEPPRTAYDVHFAVLGFPVRVSPGFWITSLVLGLNGARDQEGNIVTSALVIWVVATFVSILVHELGHALCIRRYGLRSRVILYHLGGLATLDQGDDYLYPSAHGSGELRPSQHILIALAGPGAGFLLAALLVGILWLCRLDPPFAFFLSPYLGLGWDLRGLGEYGRLAELISSLLYINIFWGLVNLLPVYPLDGGQVARELLTLRNPRQGLGRSLQVSIGTGAVVAAAALVHFGRAGLWFSGLFLALMFGLLAYNSYRALQLYRQHGFGGGRVAYEEDPDDWWKR